MDGNATTSAPASLPLSRLRVWPGNPRRTIPDLTTLTESVRKVGVLAPLLVRELQLPVGAVTHEVIAGQCRYLAATAAGLAEVPVTVREVDDATALELGLTENAQRNAPAPMEEAEALDALVRTHGRSVEDVAARLGHPVTWVRRRLALLGLGREARAWLASGKLPLAHALTLAAVDEATQLRVVERWRQAELPPARRWGAEVTLYLHTLASAPFDVDDAALPGGACGPCPKSTAAQADLFGVDPNARCTDPTCWATKVAATWASAQKAAKKRKLPVVADAVEPNWRGVARLPDGRLLTTAAPAEDARPVAVARDQHGRVLDLYEPPPAPADGDAAEEDEAEVPDDREARAAAAQARRDAAAAARRAEVTAFVEALTRSPAALVAGLRVALLTAARDLDCTRDLRVVCEAWGGTTAFATDADIVADLRAADLPLVLAATLCAAWATDPDAEDATPVERTLRELVRAPVEPTRPACGDCDAAAKLLRPGETTTCMCGTLHTRPADPTAASPLVRVECPADASMHPDTWASEHDLSIFPEGLVRWEMNRDRADPETPATAWTLVPRSLGERIAERLAESGAPAKVSDTDLADDEAMLLVNGGAVSVRGEVWRATAVAQEYTRLESAGGEVRNVATSDVRWIGGFCCVAPPPAKKPAAKKAAKKGGG